MKIQVLKSLSDGHFFVDYSIEENDFQGKKVNRFKPFEFTVHGEYIKNGNLEQQLIKNLLESNGIAPSMIGSVARELRDETLKELAAIVHESSFLKN